MKTRGLEARTSRKGVGRNVGSKPTNRETVMEFHQYTLNRSKPIEKWDQRSEVEAEWAPEIKRCFFAVANQKEKEEKGKRFKVQPTTKVTSLLHVEKPRRTNIILLPSIVFKRHEFVALTTGSDPCAILAQVASKP